jgi:NADH-quinone oxidoreductase subunit G
VPKLTVNGVEIEVEQGASILQACEAAGFEIPRFCYHERLKIAGNCRMCLVQVEKMPKLVASCAQPAADGMIVHTESELVKDGRAGVMELLLINHPLDCPICDQGGECDLQDQAYKYGNGSSRFHENKRAVKDKYMGPLVKTHMTRCIHCTRCVRFITDVAGVPELGTIGRGEHTEISTYIEKALSSELSGNIIDVCPVGALTSKPYAFKARSWELRKFESIDIMDAMGSNVMIYYKGLEVMRVLPVNNDDINEEWITDKARFAYDGLLNQRLDKFYLRKGKRLEISSFEEALESIKNKLSHLQPNEVAALAGDMVDAESMFLMKDIMHGVNCYNIDCRQENEKFSSSNKFTYNFNSSIASIDKADAILLIGCHVRKDAPLLASRIRAASLRGAKVAVIGELVSEEQSLEDYNWTFEHQNLGADLAIINQIASGKNKFSQTLKDAKNPMIIVGIDAVSRPDGEAILEQTMLMAEKVGAIREDYIGFNVLNRASARVAGMGMGFVPNKSSINVETILNNASSGRIKMLFLLGADEIDTSKLKDCFVVYIGHHGDKGANAASVVLPGCAYTEKDGLYLNLEGNLQKARKIAPPVGEAMDDRDILFKLAETLEVKLPYSNINELRELLKKKLASSLSIKNWQIVKSEEKIDSSSPMVIKDYNYYMTNPIARASKTMVNCSSEILNTAKEEEVL